jgi:hypothetical protein
VYLSIGNHAFRGCSNLSTVFLSNCTGLGASIFESNVVAVYLSGSTVASISTAGSPFLGTPSVYVP